ncbi:YggS family pyridoxal phosphate-dependent enzyme [Alkalinema sp. FACHB-956]|uniref:YggS family pyridoxal phosphate-dependent enzyme n=1 Tax=Alkalinema sp. FACHB-956 TaxID=2692768 RepID=UPI001688FCE5|nr:YggS family pyridoxal phosphate-dependent enzyme [Alkalinema sp. FACHB-956]MBD2329014.1 YggS family pyridoxal phosphate-dependent enzyme [Alkalinema sp. FACHB-956]
MEPIAFDLLVHHICQFQQSIPAHVTTIAVTKQASVEQMRAAYAAGLRHFGESRLQEAVQKQAELADLQDVTWHFIGHLQSNKVAKTLERFQWIHSVDNLKLAERIDRLAGALASPPHLCLQVKLRPDPNKSGWSVEQLLADLPQLNQLDQVHIAGLMVIPPLGLSEADLCGLFQQARDLATTINQQAWPRLNLRELSMGMSEDYQLAIASGATMIRPGRILFDNRSQQP